MVRSILEYASPLWSPYTKQDVNGLEKVQRQSARFIMGDYSLYRSFSDILEIAKPRTSQIKCQHHPPL